MSEPQHIIVMGVAGCGKSTFAGRLGAVLRWPVDEGDAFHPQSNIDKMAAGIPLDDTDRLPWLAALADRVRARDREGRSSILTCSSLKRTYRDQLRAAADRVRFIHLHGKRAVLEARVRARTGHFFPASLLDTQLADLEPLGPSENGITLDIEESIDVQIRRSLAELNLFGASASSNSVSGRRGHSQEQGQRQQIDRTEEDET